LIFLTYIESTSTREEYLWEGASEPVPGE
jgi:hypothetical protein